MASNTKKLTIAISGSYNGKAIEKAQQDLQKMQTVAAAQIGGVSTALVNAGAAAAEMGGKLTNAGKTLGNIGDAATTGITVPMVAAAAACGKAAIDIDDAMTSIRKTVDGTDKEYKQLRDAAIKFSKTNAVSPSQLLEIEALGAQLGFSIDELEEFGEVVSGLDIATNMDAETAATEMAQFANVTRMAHSQVSNYASAIVQLGNTSATTEADISSMAMRLAASATQVGMTQSEILGLAAAMSSLGIEAEAGGSALSTIMAKIDKSVALGIENCEKWAEAAGMSAEEFADAWGTDPVAALTAVLQGMDNTSQAGGNMSVMLQELGITELRQVDAMKRLAGNSDLVAQSIETANKGWTENIALSNEVENRNKSMSSRFEILKNRVSAAAVEIGEPLVNALLDVLEASQPLIDDITGVAQAFADMDVEQQKTILGIAATVAAFGPVTKVLGTVTTGIGSLMVQGGKLLQGLGRMTAAVKTTGTAATDASASVGKMTTATSAASTAAGVLKGALASIGIGLVIALVADLVGKFVEWKKHSDIVADATKSLGSILGSSTGSFDAAKASADLFGTSLGTVATSADDCLKSQAELNSSVASMFSDISTTAAQVDYYAGVIESLATKGSLAEAEQVALGEAVRNFNELTGASIEVINAQTGELSASVDEVNNLAAAWKKEAEAEALREVYKKYVAQTIEDTLALEDAQRKLNEANEGWGIWIGDFAVIADQASVDYHELQQDVEELEAAQRSAQANADAALQMLVESTSSFKTVEDALDTLGLSISDIGELTDDQMSQMAEDFDGSLKSLAASCAKQGVRIPKALADAIKKSSGLPEEQQDMMLQSLVMEMTGYDLETTAYVLGRDIDQGLSDGIAAGRTLPLTPASSIATGVIDTLKNRFQTHSPSKVTYQIGLDVSAGLSDGIAAGASDAEQSGETIKSSLLKALTGVPAAFKAQGATSGAQFAAGVIGTSSDASAAGTAIGNAAKTAAASIDLTATGKTAGTKYSTGVKGVDASSAGKAVANTAKTGAAAIDLTATGKAAGNKYAAGVKAIDAKASGQTVANTAKNGAAGIDFTATGKAAGTKYSAGVKGVDAKASGQAVANTAKTGAAGVDLTATGKAAGNKFVAGLKTVDATASGKAVAEKAVKGAASFDATASGVTVGNSISNGIKSVDATASGKSVAEKANSGAASVSAYGTGVNFTQGFVNGMNGVDVTSPAANIGASAINALRNRLGVYSPSREAAEIGRYFGAGLVDGMKSTEDAVTSEALALGDAMLFTPQPVELAAYRAQAYGDAAQGGTVNRTSTLNITVNVNAGGAAMTQEQAVGLGRTIGDIVFDEYQRRERTLGSAA